MTSATVTVLELVVGTEVAAMETKEVMVLTLMMVLPLKAIVVEIRVIIAILLAWLVGSKARSVLLQK